MRVALGLLLATVTVITGTAQSRPRGRDLGIPFPGQTGSNNAITDVAGVAVGHVTLIDGEGRLVPGQGPCARASPLSFLDRTAIGIRCLPRRSIRTATVT